MDYTPGTILCHGSLKNKSYSEAVVLKENNVYVTIQDSKKTRNILPLTDWVKSNEITVLFEKPTKTECKPRTLIRWFSEDYKKTGSRLTAVALAEGAVLQIKKVDGNITLRDSVYFSSYDEWKATFPSKGEVRYYKP
jgi:hypothetical protein